MGVMRTHSQIVLETGVTKIREALGVRGIVLTDPTVRSWSRRPDAMGSIPAPYWNALADAGISTLQELAEHAARAAIKSDEAA